MKSNEEAQSEAPSVEQLLDHLVQGVQEIPQLPKVDINDHEGIKKSMEHYYSERAKWIELTSAKINRLIVEARIQQLDELIDIESKQFMRWSQKDIAHFFERVGAMYRNLSNQLKEGGEK